MKTCFVLAVVLAVSTLTTASFADGSGMPPWPTGGGGRVAMRLTSGQQSTSAAFLDGSGIPPWPR